ncbi:peptidase M75 [Rhodobacterales bacterium HKCCE3408]|nr:peptidase M75 [Rhodobacterales bacterium HKCCE3408]
MAALLLAIALPVSAAAQSVDDAIDGALDRHILPGFATLADETEHLAAVAAEDCAPTSDMLRSAFGTAFDAWIRVSHLRFGPTETDNRTFALAFWPDSRGATPRALDGLIAAEDPAVEGPDAFADVSVAARGFYAMELLLYDPEMMDAASSDYGCALIRAMAADIARTAAAIDTDWRETHADLLRHAGQNDTYRSEAEALRTLYSAFTTGMEFTIDLRLGRPLGTFDRPRPGRAEAWRSGRSLRHVEIALDSLGELAQILALADDDIDTAAITQAFDTAKETAGRIDDPAFAGVATPSSRIRIEALQQRVIEARDVTAAQLAEALDLSAGFNSLDGD